MTFAFVVLHPYLNWRESCCNLARSGGQLPVLTVIPARLGATRLPRKPLRLLGGMPLIVRVFERISAHALGDHCVVATDDNEVLDTCREFRVPAVITRSDHASGTDRVAEVANRLEFRGFDCILNVQGDEPFVTAEAVHTAIAQVRDSGAEIGTVAVRAERGVLDRPDVVKVICADNGNALYFSRAPIPYLRDSADAHLQAEQVRQHVGVYAYTRSALLQWVALPAHPLELIERLEQLRPLAHGMRIRVAEVAEAPERGIDTSEDLARANERWNELTSR